MAGKLIVHGPEKFVIGGTNLYIDNKKIGNVKSKETVEIPLTSDGIFSIRSGLNISAKLKVYADGITEVQCKWNRLTGKYSLEVIRQSLKAYRAEEEAKRKAEAAKKKEYRMRCNVCGNVFCYTQKDLDENHTNMVLSGISAIGQISSAIGGSMLDMYVSKKAGDSISNKIKDYSKCPHCNSTSLTDISDEEFVQSTSENTKSDNHVSANSELESLLFLGIITQEESVAIKKELSHDECDDLALLQDSFFEGEISEEEFNAKKRQILGL